LIVDTSYVDYEPCYHNVLGLFEHDCSDSQEPFVYQFHSRGGIHKVYWILV
jgi:hypothetical protein